MKPASRRGSETDYGEFQTIAYTIRSIRTHLAWSMATCRQEPVPGRMHANCTYGDVFASLDCDCHSAIQGSLATIAREGCGVLVYLHQSTVGLRCIAINCSLTSAARPIHRVPTDSASCSTKRVSARRFWPIWLTKIRLLTNHPRKIVGLDAYGIEVVSQDPIQLI